MTTEQIMRDIRERSWAKNARLVEKDGLWWVCDSVTRISSAETPERATELAWKLINNHPEIKVLK